MIEASIVFLVASDELIGLGVPDVKGLLGLVNVGSTVIGRSSASYNDNSAVREKSHGPVCTAVPKIIFLVPVN